MPDRRSLRIRDSREIRVKPARQVPAICNINPEFYPAAEPKKSIVREIRRCIAEGSNAISRITFRESPVRTPPPPLSYRVYKYRPLKRHRLNIGIGADKTIRGDPPRLRPNLAAIRSAIGFAADCRDLPPPLPPPRAETPARRKPGVNPTRSPRRRGIDRTTQARL